MEAKNAMTKPVVKVRMSIRNASHRVDVDVDARGRKRRTFVKNLNADHTTKAYRYIKPSASANPRTTISGRHSPR